MNKVFNDLERKFQIIPGYSTMFSNHVLYDTIEVNISEFKKGVNVIDYLYVHKVITGVHTRPAERASILHVLCAELIVGDDTQCYIFITILIFKNPNFMLY